jgi:threonine dehydratase
VVVPVGGAGLIAGVGVAIKSMRPDVRVVGVEPTRAASFIAAMKAGGPVRVPVEPTLADGLAVPEVGPRAFALAKDRVDEMHAVGEESLSLAILRLAEMHRGVVEGGGAATLAAFLEGHLSHLAGKTVVLLLCGGNIDPMVFSRVIEHGLAVDGRLLRFTASIRDRPGGLQHLVTVIADAGASVRDIRHERAFGGPDVSTVLVDCTLEVRDATHGAAVQEAVRGAGIALRCVESAAGGC